MKKQLLAIATALLLTGLQAAHAAPITVTTVPSWDGVTSISSFGSNGTATYGEALTVPVGATTLDSFTFFLQDFGNGNPFLYQALVSIYDPVNAQTVGAALFQSGQLSTPAAITPGFTPVTINTGGIAVTPGTDIVMYFTTSGSPQNNSSGAWGFISFGPPGPASDTFTYSNNGTNFAQLASPGGWDGNGGFGPLAFTAQFNAAAPEIDPGSSTLPIAMMASLVLAGNRRRRLTRA